MLILTTHSKWQTQLLLAIANQFALVLRLQQHQDLRCCLALLQERQLIADATWVKAMVTQTATNRWLALRHKALNGAAAAVFFSKHDGKVIDVF